MKQIIVDFIARWWWVFTLCMATTLVSAPLGGQSVCVALVFLILNSDLQRGMLRVHHTLPVRRRDLTLALWFIGVLALPLISLPVLPLAVMLDIPARLTGYSGKVHEFAWLPAFAGWWLELGYGALLFLGITYGRNRLPATLRERLNDLVATLGLGLAILWGPRYLYPMPTHLAEYDTTRWLVFLAVPAWLALSLWTIPSLLTRRLKNAPGVEGPKEKRAEQDSAQGLTGVPLFLAKALGYTLLLYLFLIALIWGTGLLTSRTTMASQLQQMDRQTLVLAIIMGACLMPSQINLRMLRMLPLSRLQLTSLLMTVPVAIGVMGTLLPLLANHFLHPEMALLLSALSQFAFVTGIGALALACGFRLSASWSFGFVFFATGFSSLAYDLVPHSSIGWLFSLGLLAMSLGFYGMQRTLKVSSQAYQPRRMFGMRLDQMTQGR